MVKEKKVISKETVVLTPTSKQEPEEVKLCPTPEEVVITFAGGVKVNAVSAYSLRILKEVLSDACIKKATISSTARSNYGQAVAMYDNIETKGLKHQKGLYGSKGAGAEALKVYAKNENKPPNQVIKMMANRLEELPPMRHVADQAKKNVIDIAPSSIPKDSRKALNIAGAQHPDVTKFIPYPKDPAFHFEIDQF